MLGKKGLSSKIRLISKFMTSPPAIHVFPNISRSKGSQIMKFGQLMGIIRKIFFFKNHAENEAGKVVPDLFLFP